MKFGSKLRELRKKQKMSQAYLSETSGIPQTTISDIERGKCIPNIDQVYKLSKALKVAITEFLDGILY